jgi:hypothetical protein
MGRFQMLVNEWVESSMSLTNSPRHPQSRRKRVRFFQEYSIRLSRICHHQMAPRVGHK